MSHPTQLNFFEHVINVFPIHFCGSVIDIGSMDINGGPHELISPSNYVGVDLAAGPNVNLVERAERVSFPDNHFDVAMSSECFEHNPDWRVTLQNMYRMTRPSGLIVFSAAFAGRGEHGTSRSDGGFAAPAAVSIGQEWYSNLTVRQVIKASAKLRISNLHISTNKQSSDIYFVGLKSPSLTHDEIAFRVLAEELDRDAQNNAKFRGGFFRRSILEIGGDPLFGIARNFATIAGLRKSA